jgi:hypothetical protein
MWVGFEVAKNWFTRMQRTHVANVYPMRFHDRVIAVERPEDNVYLTDEIRVNKRICFMENLKRCQIECRG